MYLLGVYCFFEIAPLGLLFPVVFVVYRPPISGRSMLACVLLMTLVWSPYIGYEVTRSGVDVRSFVTGAGAVDSNDPANSAGQSPSGVRRILTTMRIGILGNYMRGVRTICGLALFVATAFGLAYASSRGRWLIERYVVPTAPLSDPALRLHRFLALSLLAPWGLMLVLVLRETLDPSRRFFWFWLLQVYFIGFAVFDLLPRLPLRRSVVVAAQAVMMLAILPWGILTHGVSEVRRSGYAGSGDRLAAIDRVAVALEADGRKTASIGYELAVPSWQRGKDGRFIFKVGNDYDLVFRRRHGIDNVDHADEGFTSHDEFRIVELVSTDAFRDVTLRSDDRNQFTEIARYGQYWVGRRADATRER